MGLKHFQHHLDVFGADLSRWPTAEREQATTLIAADPQARGLLAEAEELAHLLDAAMPLEVSPALRARVLAAAPKPRSAGARPGWLTRLDPFAWASGAGWATAAVAGILVGVFVGEQAFSAWRIEATLEQAAAFSLDVTEYSG